MNYIALIGRTGQEPDVREFQDGTLAVINLATTERGYTTKDGKQIADRTDWHRVVLHGGLAKVAKSYVHKGSKVFVSGTLRYREYEKDGQKAKVTEVMAKELELLDEKPKDTEPQQRDTEPQQRDTEPQQTNGGFGQSEEIDDLPF